MITLEEAIILQAVRDNPMVTKRDLLDILDGQYAGTVNQRELTTIVDRLHDACLLTVVERLPRVYFLSPVVGHNALYEFNEALETFVSLRERTENKR